MKLPLVRKHTADDVLVHSATALGTLKDLSSVISPIPCIGAVIGSGLSLIAALEKVKGDKERCDRLAGRVASMLDDVARLTSTNSDGMNDAVSATLMTMPSSLSDIQRDLEDISKKSASVRYIQRGSIAARLDRHLWNVDEASRAFNVSD
ncbi:hypothetical protein CERSUDRAFT_108860 [Gelatoporia subvermispora B]|uniref:Mixed lineage kinase domain-containing protein n=1 Tax=Ceriporiopsis subvermispora (strain B) TaxID=914234 RepID=M2R0U6_CERS8|nr:hypothetical protein CERSUDRAFT_108860 [Gelatoporia subvermispora B]